MKRDSFLKKYSDIPDRWDVDGDIVYYILRRYEKLLDNEIKDLQKNGMRLPKFFRDRRSDEEYVYDIIDGWVMEDIICDAWLRPRLLKVANNIEIKVMGTNRDRVIQKYDPRNISTKPDFVFSQNGKEMGIELQIAREALKSGYDMKVTKVKRAINNDSYFLWVIIPEDAFFILRPRMDMTNILPRTNPLWGGKMVYHISQQFILNIGGYSKMKDDLSDAVIAKLGLS